jgi:hypothetical protein
MVTSAPETGIPPPLLIGSSESKRMSSLTFTAPDSERSTSTSCSCVPGSSTACTMICGGCTATAFSSKVHAATRSSAVVPRRASAERRIRTRS